MLTLVKVIGGLVILWLALQVFSVMFSGPGMFIVGVIGILLLMSYFGDDLTNNQEDEQDLIDIRSSSSTKD